jgi:hypothetical protein
MEAIAHNKAFAKKVGVPQSVGREFSNADKGKTFKKGGDTMASKMDPKMMAALMAAKRPAMPKRASMPQMPMRGRMGMDNQTGQAGMPQPGTPAMMKKGGMAKEDTKMDKTQDKAMIKKAFGMHDKQEHKGEHTNLSKLKKGGMTIKKMSEGGDAYVGSRLNMPSNTRFGKLNPKDTRSLNESDSSEYGKELAAARKEGIVPKMTKETRLGITSKASDTMPGSEYKKGGSVKKMASGGSFRASANGIASKGKTKGTMIKMSKGGKYC